MIVSASASKGVVSDEKLTYTDVFAWIHILKTCLETEQYRFQASCLSCFLCQQMFKTIRKAIIC